MRSPTRSLLACATAGGALLLAAGPAAACGGLVGENGSIELVRTTTLAAWHDGIEHYVTSFEFSGNGESVGSIIPLPAEPIDVVRGGDWTLQRLQREVAPEVDESFETADRAAASGPGVEILLETEIDALDITVLAGGGDAVGRWALDNGFLLTPDAPEVLDFYAERSPVFLAARFDAARAAEQGLSTGQGTPVHVTMPTPRPWVPLRILGLGLEEDRDVEADVFLLTDDEPDLLAGGRGLQVERSRPASDFLLSDLRSDVGMAWVPEDLWLTHLVLDEEAGDLDYDLSATGVADDKPSVVDAGLRLAAFDRTETAVDPADEQRDLAVPGAVTAIGVGLAAIAAAAIVRRRPVPQTGRGGT
jgi:hypothetical protein